MDAFSIGMTSFVVGVLLEFSLLLLVDGKYISLPKTEWNCAQSRILVPDDVDKIECILYKKVIKND